ncbi:MAG: hypothetical protein A7315_01060 [Candidatus Altiarchaeales archaeon WOR_SM1_79]|nr:MAG: hypothetical protein A7315_01060 [Candidatus Altiarchaeales archaeon WOR_SM1_79]
MGDDINKNIDDRVKQILNVMDDVKESGLSVRKYFSAYDTPFSRNQYYVYMEAYNTKGIKGLYDSRKDGNAKKITPEVEYYLVGMLENNRGLSTSDVISQINRRFNINIKRHAVNNFRKKHGLERIKKEPEHTEKVQFAGFEILSALAYHTGIFDVWSNTIGKHMENVKDSDLFKENQQLGTDHPSERNKGKFTPEYNKHEDVRKTKFNSIEDKILLKDISRLQVLETQTKFISRKNLAVMSLPLVTLNGSVRNINKSIGNALKHICGYNYKHATIDKYLRELKYTQISSNFIKATAEFWINFWGKFNDEAPTLVCYYIDGNTKPLWSSMSCKKSKVSMNGRVMGCLEQVFIHDSFGRPTYFQTFSGNADIGNKALSLMEDIEEYLKSISSDGEVNSAMVMDSAGNAVSTLRGIVGSGRHFITILDENQVRDVRKFKHKKEPVEYKYGDADLTECKVELKDSKEKEEYIFECRGIIIDWKKGKRTVAITSLPKEMIDGSLAVKSYFDRWPYQELQFRSMKSGASIHRIAGYGKKKIPDENMQKEREKLKKRLHRIRSELKEVIDKIEKQRQKRERICDKEITLKEKTTINEGKREGDEDVISALEDCDKKIRSIDREINKIKKPHKEKFKKLQKWEKELKRIEGKDHVYVADVELDQLMTCFRMSFANLCSFFLSHCLNDEKMELKNLIQSFFMLGGSITETKGKRTIRLERNPKEKPEIMEKLALGLDVLNSFNIKDINGKKYSFQLSGNV